MTTLFRPVLIETAEQAAALPIGTVVVDQTRQVVEVKGDYGWTDEYPHYGTRDADLIGWTALVPIEAEEEFTTHRASTQLGNDGTYASLEEVRRDGWDDSLSRRFYTRWEEIHEDV